MRSRASLAPALALALLGAAQLFPLSFSPARLSPADSIDTQEITWRLLWGVHALTTHPTRLFDANTFYPDDRSYATMDYMVGLSVLAMPVRALTADPQLVYNWTGLLSLALCAWGTYLLARSVTGSASAGLVAAAIFSFNPLHVFRLKQLNVMAVHWIPWALFALQRMFERPGVRRATWLGLTFLGVITTSGYSAVLGSIVLGWAGLVLVLANRETRVRALAGSAAAVLAATLVFLPIALPYVRAATAENHVRTIADVAHHSPDPISLLYLPSVAHDGLRAAIAGHVNLGGEPAHALFPGFVAWGLALFGAVALLGRRGGGRDLWLYGGIAILGFALSLGVNLPGYRTLFELVPPLRLFRSPSRYTLAGLLGLAMLAGFATASFEARARGRFARLAWALGPTLAVLHLLETWKPIGGPYFHYDPPPPVYRWLAEQPGDFAIAELPSSADLNSSYLVYSTYHWKPLVNGYHLSFIDAYHRSLLFHVLPKFPAEPALDALDQIVGLRYVVVHGNPARPRFGAGGVETGAAPARPVDLAQLPDRLRPVWRQGDDVVLELVEPEEGWTDTKLVRLAPGRRLRSSALSFEGKAGVPGAATAIDVRLNGTPLARAPAALDFHPFSIDLPRRAIVPGINRIELVSEPGTDAFVVRDLQVVPRHAR